jgi:hypothetical protein
MNDDRIASLLGEIRDNQRQALEQQRAQIAIAHNHFEQAKAQIAESLKLQRAAISRQKVALWIALPAIVLCIAAIIWIASPYL